MKNKVSEQPKTWLHLFPSNIFNIQNSNTHAPKKEIKKCPFLFFNSGSTYRWIMALNMTDSKILANYKVLYLLSPLSVAARIKSMISDIAKMPKLFKIFTYRAYTCACVLELVRVYRYIFAYFFLSKPYENYAQCYA